MQGKCVVLPVEVCTLCFALGQVYMCEHGEVVLWDIGLLIIQTDSVLADGLPNGLQLVGQIYRLSLVNNYIGKPCRVVIVVTNIVTRRTIEA